MHSAILSIILAIGSFNVGTTAAGVSAPDCEGQTQELAALLKSGPVVLFFVPAANCVHCSLAVSAYSSSARLLAENQIAVLGVYAGDSKSTCHIKEVSGAPFPMLPDPEGHLRRAFRIYPNRFTSVIIERSGKIRRFESFSVSNRDARYVLDHVMLNVTDTITNREPQS